MFKCIQKVFWLIGIISLFPAFLVSATHAEVVLDGTLGQKGAVSGPNYVITDKMGSRAGSNLFHSFQTFNINTDESGTFTGPNSVQNVIGRVTGGTSSLIDGRLGCSIPGANLFLINPYGMMFGPNATLDVNGSFHASTADYLLLGDAGRFDAVHPEQSVLTVDPPSAFGFLDDTAAPIKVDGSYLKVPEGETLSLVGGDITLRDATLYAPGGEIDLVSVASSGEVTFGASGPGVDSFERLGDINITRSDADHMKIDDTEIGDVDVSEGGGVIYVRGGDFYVDGGHVLANTRGASDKVGGIDFQVRETIALSNRAELQSMAVGMGDAGDILLSAANVFLTNGVDINTHTSSAGGRAGDITIKAKNKIVITGSNTELDTQSYGKGDAGNVVLEGAEISLTDGTDINTTGSSSGGKGGDVNISATSGITVSGADTSIQTKTYGSGDAGDITLEGMIVSIAEGTNIDASTRSSGKGGQIDITAKKVLLSEGSKINSSTYSKEKGAGNAGNITIDANESVSISGYYSDGTAHNSAISTNTFGKGEGGDISIITPKLNMTWGKITSQAQTKSEGNAGSIHMNVGELNMKEFAQISTTSWGAGNGGNIAINASEAVSISGYYTETIGDRFWVWYSGIFANTNSEGAAGNVSLTAPLLSLSNMAQIQSLTHGEGNGGFCSLSVGDLEITGGSQVTVGTTNIGSAGDLEVNASGTVYISGRKSFSPSFSFNSGIFSGSNFNGNNSGTPGNITLNASSLIVENSGTISSSTYGDGDAGKVKVDCNDLSLRNGGSIQSKSTGSGNAGNLTIHVNNLLSIENSSITTSSTKSLGGNIEIAAGVIQLTNGAGIMTSVNSGEGKGGNVNINAPTLVLLEESNIKANADQGYGGDITINADAVFKSPDSDITASSQVHGKEGKISVNSPVQDIVNAMVPLRESFLSADELLPERCETRDPEQAGSFVVDSDEGLPPRPDELLK